jgi:hypothetical protein
MKVLTVTKLDKCKDGGTIGIFGNIYYDNDEFKSFKDTPMITIDYAIGTHTPGEWYLGYRIYGGTIITDDGFKQEVRQKVNDYIKYQTLYSEQI